MKKSIFALLFLLLALIITCVYQKTYTLYALNTSEENTTLPLKQKAEIISPEKKETVATKHSSTNTQTVAMPTMEQKPSKEPSILEKIKKRVISVVSTEDKVPQEKSVSQKTTSKEILKQETITATKTKEQPTLHTQEEEKEVVDYLLTVIKEQDTALTNRDEAETRLQALIKRALENRRIAIDNMDKASTEIEASHQERLKERDTKSQNNTEEKGQ